MVHARAIRLTRSMLRTCLYGNRKCLLRSRSIRNAVYVCWPMPQSFERWQDERAWRCDEDKRTRTRANTVVVDWRRTSAARLLFEIWSPLLRYEYGISVGQRLWSRPLSTDRLRHIPLLLFVPSTSNDFGCIVHLPLRVRVLNCASFKIVWI